MPLYLLAFLLVQSPDTTTLSLGGAIQRAVASRGRVAEARAVVAEATAAGRLARQVPNPAVTFERTEDRPHQHLTFDQPLQWLVTRGADRGAAAAGVRRARADSTLLMASVVLEARQAFYAALGARENLRLIEAQVAIADSLAALAGLRLAAGDISRFESDQAAQDARRTRQLLGLAREAIGTTEAALARAIGWTGHTPVRASGALDAGLDDPLPPGLPVDSMPLVASVVADSAALAAEYRSAQRGRIPVPSLVGGMEWGDPDRPNQGLSILGFAVPLPLWNTGGASGAAARARADRGAALAVEARLEGTRAMTQAKVRLDEAARRARVTRDSLVPAARSLREQAIAAYRAGETSIVSVLDALRSEREVLQEQVADLAAFQESLAAWYALFGRTG